MLCGIPSKTIGAVQMKNKINSDGGAFISVDWSSGMTNACCRMHYAWLVRPRDKYHAKRRTT